LTSEVGTRDGLMPSNQVEHYAPVYVARRFACCNLKIVEIDLPHSGTNSRARGPTRRLRLMIELRVKRPLYNSSVELYRFSKKVASTKAQTNRLFLFPFPSDRINFVLDASTFAKRMRRAVDPASD